MRMERCGVLLTRGRFPGTLDLRPKSERPGPSGPKPSRNPSESVETENQPWPARATLTRTISWQPTESLKLENLQRSLSRRVNSVHRHYDLHSGEHGFEGRIAASLSAFTYGSLPFDSGPDFHWVPVKMSLSSERNFGFCGDPITLVKVILKLQPATIQPSGVRSQGVLSGFMGNFRGTGIHLESRATGRKPFV